MKTKGNFTAKLNDEGKEEKEGESEGDVGLKVDPKGLVSASIDYSKLTDKEMCELIKSFEYVIRVYIKQFRLPAYEYDDVMQEGRIGIFNAIKTYKNNQGAQLGTYVAVCVRNCLVSIHRRANTHKAVALQSSVTVDEIENEKQHLVKNKDGEHRDEVLVGLMYQEIYDELSQIIDSRDFEIFNKYNYGYSVYELSEAYTIDRKKIYVIISNVRKKINEALKEGNYE